MPEIGTRTRSALIALLVTVAIVGVTGRVAWEFVSPLHFDQNKIWIYVRDGLTLGPATFAAIGALLLTQPTGVNWYDTPKRRHLWLFVAIAFVFSAVVARFVLLGIPSVVDEAAYLWQAQLLTEGKLTVPSGPAPTSTIVQYVGDVDGERISVFFPGSSLALAVGYLIHAPYLIDPLLIAGLTLVTFWAGRRLFDARVGIVAAAFFAVSPFTIFQGASFFGQAWTGLLLIPAVTMALKPQRRFEPLAVGFLVSATLLSRPASAASALAFVALVWLVRAIRAREVKTLVRHGGLAIAGGLVPLVAFLGYNQILTGDALVTAHTLLLPDENIKFGLRFIRNFSFNIAGLAIDFNGLVFFGLALLLVGLWKRHWIVWAVVGWASLHLATYAVYYNHGISYGPRYLFETTPLLLVAAAYGLTKLPVLNRRINGVVAIAVLISLMGAVPGRAPVFLSRAEYLDQSAVVESLEGNPSLVFLTAGPYEFPDPMYFGFAHNGPEPGQTDVVFVRDDVDQRCAISQEFAGRSTFVVDMDERAAGRYGTEALHPVTAC